MAEQTVKRIRPFRGPLSEATLPVVYDLFRTLLMRGPYIHISAYEYRGWEPEIRTDCVAEKVTSNTDEHTAGIMIVDDRYVWGPFVGEVDSLSINETEIRYRFRTGEGRHCWVVIVPSQDGGTSNG